MWAWRSRQSPPELRSFAHEDDQAGLGKHQLLTSTAYPSGVSVECNVQCFCNPSTDTRAGCDIALQGLASVR
jgi:hypothetical protein